MRRTVCSAGLEGSLAFGAERKVPSICVWMLAISIGQAVLKDRNH
jgi:hypothetical protein